MPTDSPAPRQITPADIVPMDQYAGQRAARRRAMAELKRNRRMEVGPFVTFYFECYETMLHQVQEMLFIEKGGPAQVPDELDAYNPLIPNGRELTATMMIEIDDEIRRRRVLAQLGGIENATFVQIDGEKLRAVPEMDQERTDETGKASSVHFLHFPFTKAQIEKFTRPGSQVILGVDHANYQHMAVLPEATRAALAKDFA